jgi:RNA polymerase sigma factor (sigma-70 family)
MDTIDSMAVNRQSLSEFFTNEQKKLVAYVRKNSKDRKDQEAEDVVQDVFLSLLERALNPIENLAAYVYRSLDNRMADLFRKKSSSEVSYDELEESPSGALDSLFRDLREDVAGKLEQKELDQAIYKAIDRLPEAQKAVFIATELEEWTFEELSELWDEPLGTLLNRKHRAVKALRKQLKKLQS